MRRWEKVPHDPHCSESCRLVQGSQRFVRKIIPEQPAQRVQNPCKQRRLQPLPCRALLEARERVCTARQREWYRRELDVTRSLSLEESRGQGLFLFTAGCIKLHASHLKAAITTNLHHRLIAYGKGCTQCSRQAKAHRTTATAG